MLERQLEQEVMDSVAEADAYAAIDHSEVNSAFVDRLLELGAKGDMLDVGTGPGHIPYLLVARSSDATVVGVDLAEHMLGLAEQNRAQSADPDRIRFQHSDAKKLPFEDESFDVVFSNTILHHIPEPEDFISEAYRVLKPRGTLLIRDLSRPANEEELEGLVTLHAGDQDEVQQGLFRDSLRAALTVEEVNELADECGLCSYEVVQDSDRHLSLQIKAGQ